MIKHEKFSPIKNFLKKAAYLTRKAKIFINEFKSLNKAERAAHTSRLKNHILRQRLQRQTKLTDDLGHPNINAIWEATKDIPILRLNAKNFGYQLARELEPRLQKINTFDQPTIVGLTSKASTQADVESPWFVYWCRQINAAPIYHRKLWEHAFLLQALYERDTLKVGAKGIGFGCGEEPLASFFASKGIKTIVSDLAPEQAANKGWTETRQHTTALEQAFYPDIVELHLFEQNVSHRYIDMNNLPNFEEKFDFCWSVCAMEHLGSIKRGIEFVEASLTALRPGGIAVHTTEFNYLSDDETIDNWPTVLFRKKDFMEIAHNLEDAGHTLLPLNFDVGNQVLDKFIDIPPYALGDGWLSEDQWSPEGQNCAHLKLAIDGFPSTCFGLIIIKGDKDA